MMGRAFGPTMEDIEQFHRDIKGWMKNPRIRKSLEAGLSANDNGVLTKILEGLKKND